MEDMLRDCGAGVASTGPSDALGEGEEGEESSCVWAVRILGETSLCALLGEERELPWVVSRVRGNSEMEVKGLVHVSVLPEPAGKAGRCRWKTPGAGRGKVGTGEAPGKSRRDLRHLKKGAVLEGEANPASRGRRRAGGELELTDSTGGRLEERPPTLGTSKSSVGRRVL